MKKFIFLLVFMFCACGQSAPVPKWKENAYEQLELYKIGFLTGKEQANEPHFIKCQREIASGNDLHLLAEAYLTKYALHAASLESFDDAEMQKIARLAPNAADAAYLNFLKGDFKTLDARMLPYRYAGILKAAASADAAWGTREISALDEPLSRLVACGVWTQNLPCDENLLTVCIDVASAHGWRRPLWAYLSKLESLHLERGEKEKAVSVRERLNILKEILSERKSR